MADASAQANPLAGGSKCPMGYGRGGSKDAPREEPPDTPDRVLDPTVAAHASARVVVTPESQDPLDVVPAAVIPAAGRGNSEHGTEWLNPSANQLFRALARKDKAIELDDAPAVAVVHEIVTSASWEGVMEYEDMHKNACSQPTLARFEGKDGIWSPKARLMSLVFGLTPFDRHDWTVDRCGKEVTYIIDYYAPEIDGEMQYFCDVRPQGLSGVWDRVQLAAKKWRTGEKWW